MHVRVYRAVISLPILGDAAPRALCVINAPLAVQPGTRALSDEQLAEVMELTKDADSVELKLTVPDSQLRSTVQSLGHGPAGRPDPAGLLLRHTRPQAECAWPGRARPPGPGPRQRLGHQLRPVQPADLPDEYRKSPAMVVEIDAMPGGYVCSATMKAKLDATAVRAVHQGQKPLRSLFTKQQRAFYPPHMRRRAWTSTA